MTRENAAPGEGTPRSDHRNPGNDRQWHTRVTGNNSQPKF